MCRSWLICFNVVSPILHGLETRTGMDQAYSCCRHPTMKSPLLVPKHHKQIFSKQKPLVERVTWPLSGVIATVADNDQCLTVLKICIEPYHTLTELEQNSKIYNRWSNTLNISSLVDTHPTQQPKQFSWASFYRSAQLTSVSEFVPSKQMPKGASKLVQKVPNWK